MFIDLWEEIDLLEKLIKAEKGTSTSPLSEKEKELLSKITPYQLYYMKKLLIEKRKTQYLLNDFCKPPLQHHNLLQSSWRGGEKESSIFYDENFCQIKPLGFYQKNDVWERPYVKNLGNQNQIDGAPSKSKSKYEINFCDPSHVYNIIEQIEDLKEESTEGLGKQLELTLNYYVNKANLTLEQTTILKLKQNHLSNAQIQKILKEKFNKTHTEPYISTIYTKQICGKIAMAAQLHEKEVKNAGDSSKFKKCKDCGEILFIGEENFTHQSRSKDGFNCRCKRCEKKKRVGGNK